MKDLFIVRHAKSSWDHPGLDDHDRPLNGRGEKAAPKMGAALAERGIRPEVILSSTANRALTTAKIIAGKVGYPESEIVEDRGIYLAGLSELVRIVQNIGEENGSAMIFGHNPGFHSLSNWLSGAGIDRFVTCAVAWIRFDDEHWGAIGQGDGELVEHLWPAMLE